VFDQATQALIGTVSSIIQAGNTLLEVQRDAAEAKKQSTVLIPFVEAIVPIVDLQQRRIEITPPPGLIE
jgi:16S rRNA processing protein RimM